jgi:hypothetical protein
MQQVCADRVARTDQGPNLEWQPGIRLADNAISNQLLVVALGTIAAGLLGTASYAAEPAGGGADEQTISEELKALEDPTILLRRVWLETEWNKYRDGHSRVEETLGGFWAWRVSTNQDWAVRLKVPYEWNIAGDAPNESDEHGLGDIKVATGTAFRLGETWRVGGGLELRTPSAADNLGDNVWGLQEFGAVAWDPTRWLTLSPSAEYNESVAEVHNAPPKHYLELYFPANFLLPRGWSVTPRYEAKVDFENDNYVTQSAKLVVAKQFDSPPLNFALSIKRQFDGGEKEFQLNFIITYFFR